MLPLCTSSHSRCHYMYHLCTCAIFTLQLLCSHLAGFAPCTSTSLLTHSWIHTCVTKFTPPVLISICPHLPSDCLTPSLVRFFTPSISPYLVSLRAYHIFTPTISSHLVPLTTPIVIPASHVLESSFTDEALPRQNQPANTQLL